MDYCADIATLLTDITDDIFLHEMPDSPDNFIGISFLDDVGPIHTLGSKAPLFYKTSIEVFVRHTDSETAFEWIESISQELDGIINTSINDRNYISIIQISDVIVLGKDKQKRMGLAIEFEVLVNK